MVIEMSDERRGHRADHSAAAQPPGTKMHAPARDIYAVPEKPLGWSRHIRIVCIGAGASGINMIRTLRVNLKDYELVVYEKNEDVGGTWLENRYPGCRCDVPSHNYQFSWRPNKEWSNFFSPAKEIGDYLCQVCDEENMRDAIKTRHRVTHAQWNEINGTWELQVHNLATGEVFSDFANFLLDGSGILNNWRWPDVPDIDAFQGTLIHTARWPKDFDYTNKVVALIGNGSTGIQLLPEIQPAAKKLYHMVRTPTWILPPRIQAWKIMGQAEEILSQIEMDEKENFSPKQIERFKSDPEFYRKFVKAIEKEVNNTFPIVLRDSPVQAFARDKVTQFMTFKLKGDAALCQSLIPAFPLGCRRMTPAPGFLEALTEPNVSLVTEGMKRFVAEGIELASGEVLKVDAIICATGFDTSFCPSFPVVGRNGNLQDIWKKETPKAYMSCAVAGVPNYFTFLGPNAPIGHGSVFTLTEHIAKYITAIIQKCQTEGIKAIVPSLAAVDDYFEHISTFMPRTSWAGSGRSWFKDGREDGPVTALHPGSRIHFFHMLEKFRGEDWHYTYDNPTQNRFHYLGNGFSTKELDPSIDSTWYLDEASASAVL